MIYNKIVVTKYLFFKIYVLFKWIQIRIKKSYINFDEIEHHVTNICLVSKMKNKLLIPNDDLKKFLAEGKYKTNILNYIKIVNVFFWILENTKIYENMKLFLIKNVDIKKHLNLFENISVVSI